MNTGGCSRHHQQATVTATATDRQQQQQDQQQQQQQITYGNNLEQATATAAPCTSDQ
jgi:transcription initiation factor TFIID subunit TAF12